ncbi:MAG TPA: cytochrome c [Gemmatimonadales bacterium]|nr:cytochrome c [Gemmatimonadales bacterium]
MLKLVSVLAAGLTAMGGWAVVSVQDLPEHFVSGRSYTIEFKIRQHGRNLLSDLEPELLVSTSGPRLAGMLGGANEQRIPAKALAAGTYAATFTAPATGPLYLTIKSSFGASNLRLYPVPVIAAGAAAPTMLAADRGRALFVAKGCNACHSNADLVDRPDNQQIKVGPELGGHRLARDNVIQKMKNPASANMPDLGLSDAEVAAIATFLTGERSTATGRD